MVLHNSLFRSGTIYDVPDIIGLIERRIEWMDCNGINQWNKSHYRERYPDGYYIQAAEKGLLYVLTAKDYSRCCIVNARCPLGTIEWQSILCS